MKSFGRAVEECCAFFFQLPSPLGYVGFGLCRRQCDGDFAGWQKVENFCKYHWEHRVSPTVGNAGRMAYLITPVYEVEGD